MTPHLSFDRTAEELASRSSGSIAVALLWSRRTHRAAVAVEDAATGTRFELEIEAGDDPLDVYEHPFAYAARAGRILVAA